MEYSYTRQRQGRDFPPTDSMIAANEVERRKKSLLYELLRSNAEAERAKTPVDGHEPEGLPPEKAR
jgi:hypothetical protein